MKKKYIQFYLLSGLLIGVWSCKDTSKPSTLEPNTKTESILSEEDVLKSEKRTDEDETTICRDWEWDIEMTSIELSPNCDVYNNTLHLAFDDYLLAERPKSPEPEAIHPLARAIENNIAIHVSGGLYSGTIIGYHTDTEQPILEAAFMYGELIELATFYTSSGRSYELGTVSEDASMPEISTTVRKPIIYFYPEETTDISVQLDFNGQLTTTYPLYDYAKGWEVKAMTDGTLFDKEGKEYYALYWEGESNHQYDLSTGFVVEGQETIPFLEEKLDALGLNRREANEFINYWLPELERNSYNLIHFSTDEYTQEAGMTITPAPETLIRIFMVYQPLTRPMDIEPQTLERVERKGFTVVEWGGGLQENTTTTVK